MLAIVLSLAILALVARAIRVNTASIAEHDRFGWALGAHPKSSPVRVYYADDVQPWCDGMWLNAFFLLFVLASIFIDPDGGMRLVAGIVGIILVFSCFYLLPTVPATFEALGFLDAPLRTFIYCANVALLPLAAIACFVTAVMLEQRRERKPPQRKQANPLVCLVLAFMAMILAMMIAWWPHEPHPSDAKFYDPSRRIDVLISYPLLGTFQLLFGGAAIWSILKSGGRPLRKDLAAIYFWLGITVVVAGLLTIGRLVYLWDA